MCPIVILDKLKECGVEEVVRASGKKREERLKGRGMVGRVQEPHWPIVILLHLVLYHQSIQPQLPSQMNRVAEMHNYEQVQQTEEHIERDRKVRTDYLLNCRASDAKKYVLANTYRDQDNELFSICMDTQQLNDQHPGLMLYFAMYRNIIFFYFLASCIMIGPMYVNSQGTGMAQLDSTGDVTGLLNFLSLGNLYQSSDTLAVNVNIFCQLAVWFLFLLMTFILRHHINTVVARENSDPEFIKMQKYTIVAEMPEDVEWDENEIGRIFEPISNSHIHQVTPVYDLNGDLLRLKDISQLDIQIIQKTSDNQLQEIEKLKQQKEDIKKSLSFYNTTRKALQAFIVLEKQADRNIVKGIYSHHRLLNRCTHGCSRFFGYCCNCCRTPIEPALRYKGHELIIDIDDIPSPQNIQWENLDLTTGNRLLRTIVVILAILIALTISSLLIGVVYILGKAGTSISCTETTPSFQTVSVSGASENDVVCYCKAHLTQINLPKNSFCLPYLDQIIAGVALQLGVAVVTVVMNQFCYLVVLLSMRFLRLRYKHNFFSAQTIFIFVSILINAGLIPLLVSSNINGLILAKSAIFILDLFNLNTNNIAYFSDFTLEWYFSFVPYVITYLIIDMVNPLIRLALACFKYCCLEGKLQSMENRTTQLELNLASLPYVFDLEMEIGQVISLIYITLLYGSGIPPVYPLCLINLMFRYWINKWLILRFSRRILGVTPDYIRVVLKSMLPACFCSLLFATWMYTAILPFNQLETYNWFVFIDNAYLYRFIFISFMPLIGLGLFVALVMDFTFVTCCEEDCVGQLQEELPEEEEFEKLKLQMKQLSSYEIRKHPNYMDVGTEMDRLFNKARNDK